RGKEHLVLEVPALQADALDQRYHPPCLANVPPEGLFASHAAEAADSCLYGLHDLLDVCDPRMMRTAYPWRVDGRVLDRGGDGRVRFRLSDAEAPCEIRGFCGVGAIRAPYAEYVGFPDGNERLDVEPRNETAPDEPGSKFSVRQALPFQE